MYDWNYFGQIYCITSQKNYMERSLVSGMARVVDMKIEMVVFHKLETEEQRFNAHVEVIKKAKGKNALIIEDSLCSMGLSPKTLKDATDFLQKSEWDLFCLSSMPDFRRDKLCSNRHNGFYETKSFCNNAYVINAKTTHKLCDMKYTGSTIENVFNNNDTLRKYAYLPINFYYHPELITNICCIYGYYIGVNINNPVIYMFLLCVVYYYIIKYKNDILEESDY